MAVKRAEDNLVADLRANQFLLMRRGWSGIFELQIAVDRDVDRKALADAQQNLADLEDHRGADPAASQAGHDHGDGVPSTSVTSASIDDDRWLQLISIIFRAFSSYRPLHPHLGQR